MDRTLIIIGAGFSHGIGLPLTKEIDEFFKHLCGSGKIRERIKNSSVSKYLDEESVKDFETTLSILLDGNGANTIHKAYLEREKRLNEYINRFTKEIGGNESINSTLRHYLMTMERTYDWLALKSICAALGFTTGNKKYTIVEVLTTIQKAHSDGVSIPTRELFDKEERIGYEFHYNNRYRLHGALNAYKLLVLKLIKHIYRTYSGDNTICKYRKFFKDLHEKAISFFPAGKPFLKDNFVSPIAFVTYNWDILSVFLAMKANRDINKSTFKRELTYMDIGEGFSLVKLAGDYTEENAALFSATETVAAYVNQMFYEKSSGFRYKLNIIKHFIPHGLFNVRICPRCHSAFMIWPDDVGKVELKTLSEVLALEPIPSIEDVRRLYRKFPKIRRTYKNGFTDTLNCPICHHKTDFSHTYLNVQTIIKPDMPPSLGNIYFDYADTFGKANHIILMGYSFPDDDLINNYFLKILSIQKGNLLPKKLTVLTHKKGKLRKWYRKIDIERDPELQDVNATIERVNKIVPVEDYRINFLGFPEVLGKLTPHEILMFT